LNDSRYQQQIADTQDKLSRARTLAPATPVFIQLAHAGRKASSATPWNGGQLLTKENGGWETLAPSAIPQLDGERLPHELTKNELKKLMGDFVASAKRADRIGIDGIELHGAHGYLLHQYFISIPLKRKIILIYGVTLSMVLILN
jgi:2,4-dienoyl-CoA reductase-like NADH-dependent reductase (Old Yellow Enzyme family)